MSVFKTEKSPYYQYDFQLGGVRYNGSTKRTSLKEARAEELRLKNEAREEHAQQKKLFNGPLTVQAAIGRYWTEVGQHHSGSADTLRDLKRLQTKLGPSTLLSDIKDDTIAALVSWRAEHTYKHKKTMKDGSPAPRISNATVNRTTTDILQKLFSRAKRTWKHNFPDEPCWKDHMLPEPPERVRELDTHEAEALDDAVRDDYADWFEYARTAATRLDETLIRWSNVHWHANRIETIGKGGHPVRTPITESLLAILERCRGKHPEFVFTYVAKVTRKDKKTGQQWEKGKRYPITYEGAKTQWKRLRGRAKVKNFRLHDLRHDVGTKVLRETGNLKIAQKLLNHRDIKTTAKYAHVFDDDLRDALERVAKSQKKSQKKTKEVA
ncbi:tyrosine-type recombinase/integrase [Hyphomicrobium sp.]|uniref:tyrosine-type recombinase/integrase n=1 Tax=Hyphomicrobium sp. TaxID=82 RepID=UPI000FBDC7AD|nr:tyrosine-type recombinase/integrase [Hyphomicrobium sp.]RUP10313.1 MAG: integrase [Hyphomicrobium sp.]